VAGGLFLWAIQVVAWLNHGALHTWLIGGGVGFLLVGGVATFFYLDDRWAEERRSGVTRGDDLPSADEYDELLDAMDRVDQDQCS